MSERKRKENQLNQGLRLLGIILTVYVLLEYVLPVIFPFCVGFLLAAMLAPVRRLLERRLHFGRDIACFLTFFLGLIAVVLLASLTGYLLFRGGCQIGKSGMVDSLYQNGSVMWDDCCNRVYQMTGKRLIHSGDYQMLVQKLEIEKNWFDIPSILDNWKTVGGTTVRLFANVLVAFVSSLLILSDFERISGWLSKSIGRIFHHGFGTTIRSIGWTYVRAQLLIIATVMSLCMAGLFLAGEKHAIGLGALIGICDALPFLGTGICFVPWALWRLLRGRYVTAIWFVLLYLITSFTRQMMEPKLIGKKIGVPPLAVLISVYLGIKVFSRAGFLLGPLAAFLIWQLYTGKEEEIEEDVGYENTDGTIGGDDPL